MSDSTPPVPPVPPAPPVPPIPPVAPPAYQVPYGTQPGYAPSSGGYVQYAPAPKNNVLAIISFSASLAAVIFFFVGSVAAVICGHIALSQIKRTGESGRGFALAGVIIGYVGIGFAVLIVFFYIVIFAVAAGAGTFSSYSG